MYFNGGRKQMHNPHSPCISHCVCYYRLWDVLWIAHIILLTVSGFARFILVQSGCKTKPVHVWVSQCTMNVPTRMSVLSIGAVLTTLDRYISKFGTYSSQWWYKNILLFKKALKKGSRKNEDTQENAASFAIPILPNLNRVIILPQKSRY